MKLRDYQVEAVEAIQEAFQTCNSTMITMMTGGGKTVIFASLAKEFMTRGRVMVIAHREELIYQAWNQLEKITGETPDIEMASYQAGTNFLRRSQLVASSVQTQIAGCDGNGRMTKFDPDEFSLVIIDECHHAPAKSYRRTIDYYRQNKNLKLLGVTATPDRHDEKALGKIFESCAFEFGIDRGIPEGWLVPITQNAVYVDGLDFSEIHTTAGDLNGRELAEVLEKESNLHKMATPTLEIVGNRKTLIFTASVAQAERMSEILNRHKHGSADWVCGTTPKDQRRYLFERYRRGEFQFLVNVGVTTEGFDDPAIEVIVQGRPTKSRSLYTQMIGRGTRPLPGLVDGLATAEDRRQAIATSAKPAMEVLDFVGNSGHHRLITSADVLGGNYDDEVVDRVRRKLASGGRGDMLTELSQAEKEIAEKRHRERQAEMRRNVRARAKYSTATVNPFDVLDMVPARVKGWNQGREPTRKQLDLLAKMGVDTKGISFTHASQMIGAIIKRREEGLCTYKQAKLLNRYGYDTRGMTFADASAMISELADNKWKPL